MFTFVKRVTTCSFIFMIFDKFGPTKAVSHFYRTGNISFSKLCDMSENTFNGDISTFNCYLFLLSTC